MALGNGELAVSSGVIGALEPPPPPQETIESRDTISSNDAIRLGCFIIRLLYFFVIAVTIAVFMVKSKVLIGCLFA